MTEIRRLTEKEIELKPCQIDKNLNWVQLLCYKTARADQTVLDETFGLNWKSDFKEIGGTLYCTISVFNNEIGEWVSRTDAGDTGNEICPEKSQASSAFKRAATQFGIGRFLYNSPTIFINLNNYDCKDGKLTQKFYVKEMEIDDNEEFTKLVITDKKGNERFTWNADNTTTTVIPRTYQFAASEQTFEQPYQKQEPKKNNQEILKVFCSNKKVEEGINLKELTKFYDFYLTRVNKYSSCNPEALWNRWNKNNFENKF